MLYTSCTLTNISMRSGITTAFSEASTTEELGLVTRFPCLSRPSCLLLHECVTLLIHSLRSARLLFTPLPSIVSIASLSNESSSMQVMEPQAVHHLNYFVCTLGQAACLNTVKNAVRCASSPLLRSWGSVFRLRTFVLGRLSQNQ